MVSCPALIFCCAAGDRVTATSKPGEPAGGVWIVVSLAQFGLGDKAGAAGVAAAEAWLAGAALDGGVLEGAWALHPVTRKAAAAAYRNRRFITVSLVIRPPAEQ